VTFGQAIASVFAKYVVFSGRSSRSEYWFWMLFLVLGGFGSELIDTAIFIAHGEVSVWNSPINAIFTVAILLPGFAVAVRRLHDTDRSGWWLPLALTGVGLLLILYWQSQDGTVGANRFGPQPLATTQLSAV